MKMCKRCREYLDDHIKNNDCKNINTLKYCQSSFLDQDNTVKSCLIYFNETLSQILDRPERSKRENFVNKCNHNCPWQHINEDLCTNPKTNGECITKMRCSEHCRNAVREAQ